MKREMVRKRKGVAAEVAVMETAQEVGVRTMAREVGVRTRAQAALALERAATGKRDGDGELRCSRTADVNLRSRRRLVFTAEETVESAAIEQDNCSRPCSKHASASSSCSSKGSSELSKEKIIFTDLQDENIEVEEEPASLCSSRERREMTPSSELRIESVVENKTERATEVNSHRRSTPKEIPTESELEEFFSAAEKEVQKRFEEKYNYDLVKDVPFDGRYEWVRLKP